MSSAEFEPTLNNSKAETAEAPLGGGRGEETEALSSGNNSKDRPVKPCLTAESQSTENDFSAELTLPKTTGEAAESPLGSREEEGEETPSGNISTDTHVKSCIKELQATENKLAPREVESSPGLVKAIFLKKKCDTSSNSDTEDKGHSRKNSDLDSLTKNKNKIRKCSELLNKRGVDVTPIEGKKKPTALVENTTNRNNSQGKTLDNKTSILLAMN